MAAFAASSAEDALDEGAMAESEAVGAGIAEESDAAGAMGAAGAAGGVTSAGGGVLTAGAVSSFLPHAVNAAATIKEASRTDFFISGLLRVKIWNGKF